MELNSKNEKELTDFIQNPEISEAQNFNSIKILASPEKMNHGLKVK